MGFVGALLLGVLVVSILAGVVLLSQFRWNECRSMGHSALYCFLDQG